jgi:hypothetical protein
MPESLSLCRPVRGPRDTEAARQTTSTMMAFATVCGQPLFVVPMVFRVGEKPRCEAWQTH